jgi:branched-chain amino acid transport system ATP-binding protein
VRGLGKTFGGVRAVTDCSFDVAAGEIKAIIGPNGAGKTTVFNLVTGVAAPTTGTVIFRGERVDGLPPHRIARLGLSRTFQNVQLFPGLSVVENVMVAAHRHAAPQWVGAALGLPAARRASVGQLDESLACLALVGLESLAFARAGDLPFGQQKLLEVARAVATRPRLLLLDEPAAGLHTTEKAEMMALIGRLRARGISILIIEHDMRLVMGVSDRVVVLDHGEKIAEGTPAEVQADPAVVRVYLGEDVDARA